MTRRVLTLQNQNSMFAIIWGSYAAYYTPDLSARLPAFYSPMLELAPQVFWGLLMATGGLAALIFSLINRPHTSSLILGAIYIFFAVLYWNGDATSPGGALYFWLGFFNILFFLGGMKWMQTQ